MVLLSWTPFAHAHIGIATGNDLLEKCKALFVDEMPDTMTDMDRIDTGYCAGYVDGVTSMEGMWKSVEGKTSHASHYCLPEEVPHGQVFKIIKRWLDINPDKLHWGAGTIIHSALLQAFPCRSRR